MTDEEISHQIMLESMVVYAELIEDWPELIRVLNEEL